MGWASRHNLLARSVNRHLGGVSVIWGAVSGDAILEQNGELILRDQVVSTEYALHNLRSDLFGSLSFGSMVSVNGDSFRVIHEPVKQGDGMFCIAVLEKLEAVAAAIQATLLADGLALVTSDGLMVVF
jgi:hypothetical protein